MVRIHSLRQFVMVRKYIHLSQDQKNEIAEKYSKGNVTLEELADHYGACLPIIRRYVKKCGLSIGVSESNRRRTLDAKQRCANRVFGVYKRCACKRGILFTLSIEDVSDLIFRPCAYCGRELVNPGRKGKQSVPYNGIDRKDNTVGYTIENVVSCCLDCNRAKSDKTLSEFYAWIEKVYLTRNNEADYIVS